MLPGGHAKRRHNHTRMTPLCGRGFLRRCDIVEKVRSVGRFQHGHATRSHPWRPPFYLPARPQDNPIRLMIILTPNRSNDVLYSPRPPTEIAGISGR